MSPRNGIDPIVATSWAGTLMLTVSATAAVVTSAFAAPAAVVALVMFAAGIGVFFWAYAVAVQRSRTDAIGIGGLFFLAGSTAPKRVKWSLLSSLALQTTVAFATAGARPFTSLAFGVLTPLYGLGLAGLWGAKNGTFERRDAPGYLPPRRGGNS